MHVACVYQKFKNAIFLCIYVWCKNQNIDSIQQILEEEESSLVEVLVELSRGFTLNKIRTM